MGYATHLMTMFGSSAFLWRSLCYNQNMKLNNEDRTYLLELARGTIAGILEGDSLDDILPDQAELSTALQEKCGVFVTLHSGGDLRGCIGYIFPMLPLWEAVMENARNAAFRDPRFTPLQPSELDGIEIEISVLTQPERIDSIDDFVLGRDGIILKRGQHQAVFLPQVAPEQGWDVETTMRHLSMKAGLGPEEWRESSIYETFQAQVFGEA